MGKNNKAQDPLLSFSSFEYDLQQTPGAKTHLLIERVSSVELCSRKNTQKLKDIGWAPPKTTRGQLHRHRPPKEASGASSAKPSSVPSRKAHHPKRPSLSSSLASHVFSRAAGDRKRGDGYIERCIPDIICMRRYTCMCKYRYMYTCIYI